MPAVVLKLFAGQGTRRMDGRTDKAVTYISLFGEHKSSERQTTFKPKMAPKLEHLKVEDFSQVSR